MANKFRSRSNNMESYVPSPVELCAHVEVEELGHPGEGPLPHHGAAVCAPPHRREIGVLLLLLLALLVDRLGVAAVLVGRRAVHVVDAAPLKEVRFI